MCHFVRYFVNDMISDCARTTWYKRPIVSAHIIKTENENCHVVALLGNKYLLDSETIKCSFHLGQWGPKSSGHVIYLLVIISLEL